MAKYKLTKQEVLELYTILNNISGVKNTKFNLTKIENKFSLKKISDPLIETQKDIFSHIQKYNEERNRIIIDICKKDEKGNPIIKRRIGDIVYYDLTPEQILDLEKKCEFLKETKYKDEFLIFEKTSKEFEEILKEEIEVEIKNFKKEDLPEDLDEIAMEGIFKYIH